MSEPDWANLTFAVAGVLGVAVAIPLMRRRVKPNSVYGLRTKDTLADEQLWYEANAKTGVDLLIMGLGQLLISALFAARVLPDFVMLIGSILWWLGAAVFSVVHGMSIIRDYKRGRDRVPR